MKLGILAFQNAINYGAVLQIYALQTTIEKMFGNEFQVQVINYDQKNVSEQYKLFKRRGAFFSDLIRNLIYLPSNSLKNHKFKKFNKKYLKLSRPIGTVDDLSDFGILIVGSDQVWNPTIQNFNSMYFFKGVSSQIKRISYAASIGISSLNSEEEEYLSQNINLMDSISVREENAKNILKKYTDKQIDITLDPTLLLSKTEWLSIASNNISEDDSYLLVYSLQNNDELVKTATKIAKQLNLDIKFVKPFGNSIVGRASTEYSYGPNEFIELFVKAKYVVTNSFHGTCFSIIFNKNFITIPHKERGVRMIDLLNLLNLNDRIIYSSNELSLDRMSEVDFYEANQILGELQKRSKMFLTENLKPQE